MVAKRYSRRLLSRTKLSENVDVGVGQSCVVCQEPLDGEDEISFAQPDTCIHLFHEQCLQRWAERENSCPHCKQRFSKLGVYDMTGKLEEIRPVDKRDQRNDDEEDDMLGADAGPCMVCGSADDSRSPLLLCDGLHGGTQCSNTMHVFC